MEDNIIPLLVEDIRKWKGIVKDCSFDNRKTREYALKQLNKAIEDLERECGGKDTEKY